MNERTIKCPICGEPYVVYAFYSGDQSACPSCRDKALESEKDKIRQASLRRVRPQYVKP